MKSGSVSVDSSSIDTDRPFFPGFFFGGADKSLPFDGPLPGAGPLGRRTTPSTSSASKESAVPSSIAVKKVLTNRELKQDMELTIDVFLEILGHGPLGAFPVDLA